MAIKNAPAVPNDGGHEKRVAPTPAADSTAGKNDGGFEKRAAQESGTH